MSIDFLTPQSAPRRASKELCSTDALAGIEWKQVKMEEYGDKM